MGVLLALCVSVCCLPCECVLRMTCIPGGFGLSSVVRRLRMPVRTPLCECGHDRSAAGWHRQTTASEAEAASACPDGWMDGWKCNPECVSAEVCRSFRTNDCTARRQVCLVLCCVVLCCVVCAPLFGDTHDTTGHPISSRSHTYTAVLLTCTLSVRGGFSLSVCLSTAWPVCVCVGSFLFVACRCNVHRSHVSGCVCVPLWPLRFCRTRAHTYYPRTAPHRTASVSVSSCVVSAYLPRHDTPIKRYVCVCPSVCLSVCPCGVACVCLSLSRPGWDIYFCVTAAGRQRMSGASSRRSGACVWAMH